MNRTSDNVTWKETIDKSQAVSTGQSTTDVSNKRSAAIFDNPFASGTESLLSFWMKKLKYEENKRHPTDFAGRQNGQSIAPLYVHLTEKTATVPEVTLE